MKKKLISILAAVMTASILMVGCGTKAESKEEITVYTALEEDIINQYLSDYEKDHPDVKVNIVRDSTGVITAKLKAEKDNPVADVVWGIGASNLFMIEDQLEPYSPKGLERVSKKFKDSKETPKWVGMEVSEAGFIVNNEELKNKGIEAPKSYKDLLKPEYKGLITMPNPVSSGTGFLIVSGILQTMGEEEGWKYLDKLNENIAMYTHSGSKPAVNSSKGEFPVGVSIIYRGVKEKAKGAPVDVVFPEEGVMWDVEANALVKKSNIKEASKEFLDWAISDGAMGEYQTNYPIITVDNDNAIPAEYPKNINELLIDVNFDEVGKAKDKVTEEWSKRYDSKSEKK
ncbi:putative 2-aminoethylphosphonate ABC transporter substrate-binding protein [Clostridium sp.]|uniref:putative 2-aminoethylphosphonate ABC transporter substrate-binding protein n=1 Tax=Clostridium sp. TaxID=1506 RepID=UPI002FC5A0F0